LFVEAGGASGAPASPNRSGRAGSYCGSASSIGLPCIVGWDLSDARRSGEDQAR
jgi:hypothetical protein